MKKKTIIPLLIMLITIFVSCSKEENGRITVHVKNQYGTAIANQLVYEFSFPVTNIYGSRPQFANYVRETDKSGNAFFEVTDFELNNGYNKGVVYFTVFDSDSVIVVTDSLLIEKGKSYTTELVVKQ